MYCLILRNKHDNNIQGNGMEDKRKLERFGNYRK